MGVPRPTRGADGAQGVWAAPGLNADTAKRVLPKVPDSVMDGRVAGSAVIRAAFNRERRHGHSRSSTSAKHSLPIIQRTDIPAFGMGLGRYLAEHGNREDGGGEGRQLSCTSARIVVREPSGELPVVLGAGIERRLRGATIECLRRHRHAGPGRSYERVAGTGSQRSGPEHPGPGSLQRCDGVGHQRGARRQSLLGRDQRPVRTHGGLAQRVSYRYCHPHLLRVDRAVEQHHRDRRHLHPPEHRHLRWLERHEPRHLDHGDCTAHHEHVDPFQRGDAERNHLPRRLSVERHQC